MGHPRARHLFLLIYFLSGSAALVYEVVWSRLLVLHTGHTVAAVGTVLAAFMGGLAGGAALAGRFAFRLSRPRALRLYGLLECVIAACALLVPAALAGLQPMLSAAYADGDGGAWFGFGRLVSSLAVLLVPTLAMGATFPLAVRWFAGRVEDAGFETGALYALNTLGAALGAGLAGFVLLPWLGLRGATLVGVALNVAVGASALGLAPYAAARTRPGEASTVPPAVVRQSTRRRQRRSAGPGHRSGGGENRAVAGRRADPPPHVGRTWLAASALGLSGFVALTYQVAWTRILALVIGPTTYAFSAMLTTFIGGLACGAAVGARLSRWRRYRIVWLGLTLILSALGAFGALWFIVPLSLAMARAAADPDALFASVMAVQVALAAGLLLPMTLALGAAFPLAVAVAARREETISVDAGAVYAVNTVGAIAGALLGSFVFIPFLGLQQTVLAASVLGIAGGSLLLLAADVGRRTRFAVAAAAVAVVGAGAALPDWNRALISSGTYWNVPDLPTQDLRAALEAGEVLYYEEGAAGTVAVRRTAGSLTLAIDGKVDASNAADMLTQSLLAHLPLLLHPDPQDVGIIGLGSGVTLGAALRHPIRRADMMEISPQVVEASAWFEAENRGALADPRTRLILTDGRSHLLLSSQRYDVIVSEPSNPWMAGVATLFTREFFQAARDRLKPRGILCQWAHTYGISDADLRSITRTFLSVFPEGAMWLVGDGDVLLIGSVDPLEPRLREISAAWERPGVRAALSAVGVRDPFSVLSLFVGSGEALRRYSGRALLQTDDHNALEFSAPRGLYAGDRSTNENARALRTLADRFTRPLAVRSALESAGAREWRNRGLMQLNAAAYATAYDDLARAVRLAPSDREALAGLVEAAGGSGREQDAARLLEGLASQYADAALQTELSRVLALQGAFDDAVAAARKAVALDPSSAAAREQLASLFVDLADAVRLEPIVRLMESLDPDGAETLYHAAALHFLHQRYAEAAALGERAVALDATDARTHNLLGAAYATLGQADEARRAFRASVRANPRDPVTYVNLGLLELQAADWAAAGGHFAEALTLDAGSTAALAGLADALERQGETERAANLRRGLQRNPTGIR
jgi:spermidine synthase